MIKEERNATASALPAFEQKSREPQG